MVAFFLEDPVYKFMISGFLAPSLLDNKYNKNGISVSELRTYFLELKGLSDEREICCLGSCHC